MARRIKVIYVGGTLGMVPSAHGMVPGADLTGALSDIAAHHPLEIEPDLHVFDRLIDSSEADPHDWQAVIDAIRAGEGAYDGFVVLHGTDTLAYTAPALAFALSDVVVPIVVTGAQRSIVESDSDAPGNIAGALAAANARWSGVGLFFDDVLLPGSRATKVSATHLHAFDSPNATPLARVSEGRWDWGGTATGADTRGVGEVSGVGWAAPAPYTDRDIAVVTFAPGLSPARLRAAVTPAPEVVLMRAYGSGQAPGHGGATSALVEELVEAGVPVLVVSQCTQGAVDLDRYATGAVLARSGAHGVGDMTFEAAYTKLAFLLSQGVTGADIPRWMATNLAGEVTPAGE